MFCWGKSSEGQLGLGDIGDEPVLSPKKVEATFGSVSEIKDIVCGWEHTAVLKQDGVVYTCGSNENGQLGHHKDGKKLARVDALETCTIKQVVCGQMHTLAVTNNGLVFSWGDNTKGQLGQGNLENSAQSHPRIVKFPSSGVMVTQVACGARHSLALTTGGVLFSWGDNKNGQLGIGNSSSVHFHPEQVTSLFGVPFALLCAGGYHSFALSLSGALFSWGRNNFGQLGVNDSKDRFMPVLVKSLRSQRVRHVTAGEYHTAILTEDGGVFTFGCGSYGQLGHNSNNDEYNPRKVFELMGKVVTQVACGRLHTLAYVASSKKLYSFGSGESGQLGNKQVVTINSPVAVDNSWVSNDAKGTDSVNHNVLQRIATGGDHCYVLTLKNNECSSCDLRIQDTSKHLWTLSESSVQELVQQLSQPNPSVDILHKLETVFSSKACLNGSFLDRSHEQTNPRTHGIHLSSARASFGLLNRVCHQEIINKMFVAVTRHVIYSLGQRPPDIEDLRVYLLLPEFSVHQKKDDFKFNKIVIPFSEAILKLSAEALKVLRRWWSSLPSSYFSSTIEMFKDCIKYLLHFPPPKIIDEEAIRRQSALASCLGVLEQLNLVNTESDIVQFNTFYIPEIQAKIDIRADYYNWLQNQIVTNLQEFRRQFSQVQTFSFCRYPFVFDAEAKSALLQTDAIMQMQSAVEEVTHRNVRTMMSLLPINPDNPLLVIVVKRENIVDNTLHQIMKCGPCDLKKPLKIVFYGEEAVDAGGVKKEFFMLLMTEILDPKFGMFTYIEESQTIWFNDTTFEESPMFLLIGVICGLAIYNSTIIDVRFPPVLYKKLLGRIPTLEDFKGYKPQVARNLENLLQYEDDDFTDTFGLNFQIVRETYGVQEYIELIPDGATTVVTLENRQQYVDVYIDYYLNKSVEKQFNAFSAGFHRVCGGRVLEFFHPEELMQMVVGCKDYDFRELEQVAEYKGDYHKHHPVIRNFWEVFFGFQIDMKKKFLVFLTGSDRVPILGIKAMKIIIQPVPGGQHGDHLPVAHTCFNLLDLPRYGTKDMMKTKLSQAVEYSKGFGLV